MCGIAGVFGAGSREGLLDCALEEMRSRGPDDTWIGASAGGCVGMVRLGIINQHRTLAELMASDSSGLVLLNGEIWNVGGVARGLGIPGAATEQEVILEVYRRWGPVGLEQLEGIYALAIVDPHNFEIVLARDPLGVKPLYLAEHDGTISFSSDPYATSTLLGRPLVCSPDYVRNSLVFGFSDAHSCPILGVRMVEPGERVVGSQRDGVWTWRSLGVAQSSGGNEAEPTDDELLEGLLTVVGEQLAHDETGSPALLLSGGVDSTLLACITREIGVPDLRSYVFGSDAADLQGARAIADRLAIPLEVLSIDQPKLSSSWRQACDRLRGATALSLFHLFDELRGRRPDLKVVYCGEGADELFGGYPWNLRPVERAMEFESRLRQVPSSSTTALIQEVRDQVGVIKALLDPDEQLRQARRWSLSFDRADQLTGNHTVPFDVASMAFSFELRVPFLDHRIAGLAARYSPERLVEGERTKAPLRRVLRRLDPEIERLTRRPKRGIPASFSQAQRTLIETEFPNPDLDSIEGIPAALARSALQIGWLNELRRLPIRSSFVEDDAA